MKKNPDKDLKKAAGAKEFHGEDLYNSYPNAYGWWKIFRSREREERIAAGKSIKDIENDDHKTYCKEVALREKEQAIKKRG